MGIMKEYEYAMSEGLSFDEFKAWKFGSDDSRSSQKRVDDPRSSQKRVDDPPAEMPPFVPPKSHMPVIKQQMSMLGRHEAVYRAKLKQDYEYAMNALDSKDYARARMHLGMVDDWAWYVVTLTNELNSWKQLARDELEENSELFGKRKKAMDTGVEMNLELWGKRIKAMDTEEGVKLVADSHPKAAYVCY